jgi:Glycosyl hydrolase family 99
MKSVRVGRYERVVLIGALLAAVVVGAASDASADTTPTPPTPAPTTSSGSPAQAIPLLAYYYIWFDTVSWRRAKIDYPEAGRYSSDDPLVLRQHIEWAKAAGINGFIVSWKNTDTNNRRLRLLMQEAARQNFKLAVIYQGLDFSRRPQPIDRIAADFRSFHDQFAGDPVFFRLGGKPLTIWSGTWAYSPKDVSRVTNAVRKDMLVLATEKNVPGYLRLTGLVDGNAYYWSSVNPATNTNYGPKLVDMGRAVHQRGDYWLAPLAPGFDARLVGGTRVVDRNDGQTLRTQYATALSSSPDMLGLISWNEFSENTHIEPSVRFGRRYLDILESLRNTAPLEPSAAVDSSDSSDTAAARSGPSGPHWPGVLVLLGFPVILVLGVRMVAGRRRRHTGESGGLVRGDE